MNGLTSWAKGGIGGLLGLDTKKSSSSTLSMIIGLLTGTYMTTTGTGFFRYGKNAQNRGNIFGDFIGAWQTSKQAKANFKAMTSDSVKASSARAFEMYNNNQGGGWQLTNAANRNLFFT